MKIKISWPTGIIIAIIAFMVFILSFVYKVTFMEEYDHHLVSEDYYMDELNYQQEIDKLNNASVLEEDIALEKVDNGLLINFPSKFDPSQITGLITFKRLSNIKMDFKIPIKLQSSKYLLSDAILVEGRWDVKIEWTINNTTYLFKEKLMY